MSETREALGDDIEDVGSDEQQIVIVPDDAVIDKVPTDAEIDREREAGDVEGTESEEDPDPKPKTTAEDRLKRARAENKRLRRQQSDMQSMFEQLQRQVAELGSAQTQQQTAALAEQKAALQQQYAQAKAIKRQARETGDLDKEEQADEALYVIRSRWEKLEAAPVPQPRQQPSQQQQPRGDLSWTRTWADQHDWFDDDPNTEDPESQIVHATSLWLANRGIPAGDPRHRPELERKLAVALPTRFGGQQRQQARPRPGQTVAGASRGTMGAVNKGADWIPPVIEAQYAKQGVNTKDQKWRSEVVKKVNPNTGRTYGEDWKRIFGGQK